MHPALLRGCARPPRHATGRRAVMNLHANAKLGLAGRRELVLAIEAGVTLRQAAVCFSVSPATAHRWWHRWLDGGRTLASLADRSSRPHRQPRRLTAAREERILRVFGDRLVVLVDGRSRRSMRLDLRLRGVPDAS